MAQISTLKDRRDKVFYPVTSIKAVFDDEGRDLETRLADERVSTNASISNVQATMTASMGGKVDKVSGKGLSSNDYTAADKSKLAALPTRAGLSAEIELAKRLLFRDRWLARLALTSFMPTYEDDVAATTEDCEAFGLNGLLLSYDEAVVVDAVSPGISNDGTELHSFVLKDSPARTLFPVVMAKQTTSMASMFDNAVNLEAVALTQRGAAGVGPTSILRFALTCRNLHTIYGEIDMSRITTESSANMAFTSCNDLENVRLKNLKVSVSFPQSHKLSLESLVYLVENAANTTAITIGVHANVYAKLSGDTNNSGYINLSAEEKVAWTSLVAVAAEKNIQFAC